MSPADCKSQLLTLIKQARICGERVLDLLQQENTAILARDGMAIEALVKAKLQAFERWEQVEKQRLGLLQQLGFSADNNGMRSCLKACDTSGQLQASWDRLLDLTAECRRQNEVNGASIEISRQQASEALAILRGQSGNATTYGAGGTTHYSSSQRDLGRA